MILLLLYVVCLISVFGLLIQWYLIQWKFRKLPGPTPMPIVGNMAPFLVTNDRRGIAYGVFTDQRYFLYHFIRKTCDEIEEEGLGMVYFGPKPGLFVTKPEFVSEILRDTSIINKGEDYGFLNPWLGNGLITSNGKQWKQKRKLLSPTFHSQILDEFIPVINEQIDKFISIIDTIAGKDYVDIRPLFTNLTLDIISATAMSVSLDTQRNDNQQYIRSMDSVLLLFMQRVYSTINRSQVIYPLTIEGQKFNLHCESLRKHTMKILKKKKLEMEREDDFNRKDEKKMSFMELLLKTQKLDPSITDEEIREDVDTFMFAGHDTSAVCLKWTFLLIANDQKVQEKIREELNAIFGYDYSREINKDDLSKMHYIECVLKEGLRLYPPVPIIQRLIDKDLELDEYKIPKGVTAFIHLHRSQRDARLFPNPDEFIPERFLDMSNNAYQTAFNPFAAGPRNCVGQRFAMIEMKLILAQIFRRFSIKANNKVQDIESRFEVIYKPMDEIKIKFKRLNV